MLPHSPLQLTPDFNRAIDLVEQQGKHMLLTGRAGTGKSTWLQLFRKLTKKKAVTLAPTGIAALNVGGQTIHSFFRFPPRPLTNKDITKVKPRLQELYRRMEILIIDEISMVRADLLDHIDRFLRLNRPQQSDQPFGGVQLLLVGDLFQLPPVVSSPAEQQLFVDYYRSPWFFDAQVMDQIDLEHFELHKVYRQAHRHFLRLLDAIRLGQADFDDLEDLNERCDPNFPQREGYITLSPYNAVVDRINQQRLNALSTPLYTYHAKISGKFDSTRHPTEQVLRLKVGAQVMFVTNDPEKRRFVNGTIGKVVSLDTKKIEVAISEGDKEHVIEVMPYTWEIREYQISKDHPSEIETKTVGTFEQYPLRLAWAMTIHKSQGKTFDRVIIDMGRGAFESGQTYVALSRCRTLEGIVLRRPLHPKDIITDPHVIDYYRTHMS